MEEENSFMGEPAFEMDAKERESDVKIEPAFESGNKPKQPVKLKKSITVLHAVGMMAGGIIGSGIFFTPHAIFKLSGSVGMAMLVWVGSGLLALGGGLCYCELGVSFPESGGEYVYLHAAFGPFAGFLFLWMTVLLIRPVSQAAITLAFALHIAEPFYEQGCEPEPIVVSLIGIALTVFLAILNVRSVKGAVFLQSWLTVFKVIALIAIVALAIFQLARGDSGSLTEGFSHTTPSVGKVGLAFYQSLWAYDGWNALNYVAEEIPNPSKNLPRAVASAVLLVITCYLTTNIAYFLLLTRAEFLSTPAIAVRIGGKMLGTAGLAIVPVAVALSCLGASCASLYIASRVLYAAGRKGQLPSCFGLLHVDYHSPVPAIVFQSILASFYILVGNYEALVDAFSFMIWIFYLATFISLYVIRRRMPNAHRPYKVWIWLPALMIAGSCFLVIAPIVQEPVYLLVMLGLIPGAFFYFAVVSGKWKISFLAKANNWMKRLARHLCNLG